MKSHRNESARRTIRLLGLISMLTLAMMPAKTLAQGQGTLVKDTYTGTQGQASNSNYGNATSVTLSSSNPKAFVEFRLTGNNSSPNGSSQGSLDQANHGEPQQVSTIHWSRLRR